MVFSGCTNKVEFINYYPQHIERMLYTLTGEKVLNDDYSTNYDALEKASETIRNNAAEILYENGGIIRLKVSGEYLLSTIMYDENWHIWVNARKTAPEKFMEYFLSVPVGGSAEVTMIYIPRGFVPGLLIMAAALCFPAVKRYKNKEKKKIYE